MSNFGQIRRNSTGVANRIPRRPPLFRCHFEPAEIECGRNDASHQGPIAERHRRLPCVGRNDRLRLFVPGPVGTECVYRRRSVFRRDRKPQRRAGVKGPDFHRVHAMPSRYLSRPKKKIDRRRDAPFSFGCLMAVDFAETTAFRMRAQIQERDDFVRRHDDYDGSAKTVAFMDDLCENESCHAAIGAYDVRHSPTAPRKSR